MTSAEPVHAFVALPDPGTAGSLDELVHGLRELKAWAGGPSYDLITNRINKAWTAAGRHAGELARRGTVVDCFKSGRRRLNADLVIAVVQALHPDAGYVAQWHQAVRVVLGEAAAAVQVRVQDRLPDDPADFTGRGTELDLLRQAMRHGRDTGTVVISAIQGMAGVGKTRLAIHAGHLLARERPYERVLFVNLRGFHPDPTQPPADPAAVLDGFLRLLGVPGHQIPHDTASRTALFRQRLAGRRALLVLDNAADEEQVRPLLPAVPGCVTLITSRRSLAGLDPATRVPVTVFTPDEALELLKRSAPEVPVGDDPDALVRVARSCGYLPLALGLVAAQMRAKPRWSVTDHADRLDERQSHQRLDSAVEVALSLSYRQLPPARRRLFRLLALHPGQDLDGYAAAALADIDPDTAAEELRRLAAEHLLQPAAADRYALHDLVRSYAADRAVDEDRPPHRRAALTRLYDQYLHTASAAMNTLYPADRHRRPQVDRPAVPTPPVADAAAARAWLETEHPNLIAAAVHAATHGWTEHTITLSATLFRHIYSAGHYGDGLVLYGCAADAAEHRGDQAAQARALDELGHVEYNLGRSQRAAEHHRQALELFQAVGDRQGAARALNNLGSDHSLQGEYRQAADCHRQALALYREIGESTGEAAALGNLGIVGKWLGVYPMAADHHRQALDLYRRIGDRIGEACALTNLGLVQEAQERYREAYDNHRQALALFRQAGYRGGEAHGLTNIGVIHQRLGRLVEAEDHQRTAVTLFREIGDRAGEALAVNNLGETLHAAGAYDAAHAQFVAALSLADELGDRHQRARAHDGIARSRHAVGDAEQARHHWRLALAGYTELGVPEAARVRTSLAALDTIDRSQRVFED